MHFQCGHCYVKGEHGSTKPHGALAVFPLTLGPIHLPVQGMPRLWLFQLQEKPELASRSQSDEAQSVFLLQNHQDV